MNLENLINLSDLLVETDMALENLNTCNELIFKDLAEHEQETDSLQMLINNQTRNIKNLNDISLDYLRQLSVSLEDIKTLVNNAIDQQRQEGKNER